MTKYIFDEDFSEDSLNWIQTLEEKELSFHFSPTISDILQFQKEIINNNNAAYAYFFAAEFNNINPHLMQKIILDNNSAKYAFLFAQNIPNADIKALQNTVIQSNKTKWL